MAHAPSTYRDILRRLKRGDQDARSLLNEALAIPDSGWAAQAAFHVSGDRRLQFDESKKGLEYALKRAKESERLARRVEIWIEIAPNVATWREGARNPEARVVRDFTIETILKDIETMANGEWVTQVIAGVAPHVGVAGRQRLLGRALRNMGDETAGAKAILKAAGDDHEGLLQLLEAAPPHVRAAVMSPDDALPAAWAIEDPAKRAEAVRVLIWKAESEDELQAISQSAASQGMADQVRVWTQVGARLDKMGLDGSASWAAAEARLEAVPEPQRTKLARKLEDARSRAQGAPAKPAEIPPATNPESQAPKRQAAMADNAPPRTGHTLALMNTYEGGLKMPHLRAAARAAPLCYAFGLDLALVDFPIEGLESLVAAVETETGIGEGGRYLNALLDAGRLLDRAPNTVVATTPKPDPAKLTDLTGIDQVCLLMGLGPQGLSRNSLELAQHHYEITGANVSLETATAMGILADRLGRLKRQ